MFCHFRNHYRVNTNITDFPASVVFCAVPEHKLPIPGIIFWSHKSVDTVNVGTVCFMNGVIELECIISHHCRCGKVPSRCVFRQHIVFSSIHENAVVREENEDAVMFFIVVVMVIVPIVVPGIPELIPRDVTVVV